MCMGVVPMFLLCMSCGCLLPTEICGGHQAPLELELVVNVY